MTVYYNIISGLLQYVSNYFNCLFFFNENVKLSAWPTFTELPESCTGE